MKDLKRAAMKVDWMVDKMVATRAEKKAACSVVMQVDQTNGSTLVKLIF